MQIVHSHPQTQTPLFPVVPTLATGTYDIDSEPFTPIRLAVVGSRTFKDTALVEAELKRSMAILGPELTIVTGGAAGADRLAEQWARREGLPVVVHYANWDRGPIAGPERNSLIVNDAEAMLAFWDGQSAGTRDSIRKARAKGIPVRIVQPRPAR